MYWIINGEELLVTASEIFKSRQVDTIVVTNEGMPVGMLDIQDLNRSAN